MGAYVGGWAGGFQEAGRVNVKGKTECCFSHSLYKYLAMGSKGCFLGF